MSDQQTPMDPRCPRQLTHLPDSYCPLAVQRLKALRHAGKELSEDEENMLPGCTWCIGHQLANYCFFKFIGDFTPDDKSLSDMEIAHFMSLSVDTVKKVEKRALHKIREGEAFKEIIDNYGNDAIMEDRDVDIEFEIKR